MASKDILFSGSVGIFDPATFSWKKIHKLTISDNGTFDMVIGIECTCIDSAFDFYLLPGFLDAHCHLLETPYYSELSSEIWNISEEELISRAMCNIRVARNSGITALKDLGGRNFSSISIIKSCTNDLSRVITSGCYFTWENGHEYDRGAIVIKNIDEFEEHLQSLISHSIGFVKILHDDVGFDSMLLKNMISLAHERGMKVSCHAYTNKAATEAVAAGTDILEHVGDYDDALLTAIKDSGVIIVPTFAAAYDSTCENCADLTDINPGVLQTWLDGEKKAIPKLIEKGIPFALGSDAGFYCFPMDYLHREIMLLHDVFGLSMKQIAYAAFVTTPRCFGMENKLGRIAPHYYADFLVYGENPLKNLAILRNPSQVWIGGNKVVDLTQNDFQIRRLVVTDVNQIVTFLSHNYFNCGKLDDHWSEDDLINWVKDNSDYCTGVFLDEEMIGFCLLHHHIQSHKVHLENIFVKEEFRHRGIARRMLDETIKHYSAKHPKVRFVGLVDTGNIPSINLLKNSGFTTGTTMLWMQRNVFDD